jgi:hypothetical protein
MAGRFAVAVGTCKSSPIAGTSISTAATASVADTADSFALTATPAGAGNVLP